MEHVPLAQLTTQCLQMEELVLQLDAQEIKSSKEMDNADHAFQVKLQIQQEDHVSLI
jgi:hypothetical protein